MADGSTAPLLTVVVPVRADPRLADCLGALRRQSLDRDSFEIVVADNEPADPVRQLAARFAARYVPAPDGGSYAARARGAAEARGRILVFTDADCVPPRDWLTTIAALFADPRCLVATGPSVGVNRRSTVARWVHAIDDARWRRLLRADAVAFCDTRNLAIRRDVLMEVPFDPLFRQAGDVDLGLRLHARRIPIRLEPTMTIAHDDPTSLVAILRRGVRRGRGLAMLERKHGRFAGSTGARPLRIGSWDAKSAVLRWGRRRPLRPLLVAGSWFLLAPLLVILSAVARVPGGGGDSGLRAFVLFERLSLLVGRLSR